MLIEKTKYAYSDVAIVPAQRTYISSRADCDARYGKNLPIFTAPMTSVVGEDNFNKYIECGIQPILPRTAPLTDRLNKSMGGFWAAYSLQEFIDAFDKDELLLNEFGKKTKALIDVANGHMMRLYDAVRKVRERYGDKIEIMVGNIANPETYLIAAKAGVDYVRCGVGSGGGCFVEGTQVTMADGTTRNIEDIDKGDFVLTINGPQKVTNTFIKGKQDTITINDNIECTLDHKFFVVRKTDITEGMTDEEIKEKGFYLEAQYLCEDYLLVMVYMKLVELTSVKLNIKKKRVFDLEVENEHSYIANNYVVHNCITSSNTAVHFPMASLISEIHTQKKALITENERKSHNLLKQTRVPKIIADGGIRNYSDAIKALALGADYVMIGSVFAQTMDSSAKKIYNFVGSETKKSFDPSKWKELTLNDDCKTWSSYHDGSYVDLDVFSEFYGMASKTAQKMLYGKKKKTAEGITKNVRVIYSSIKQWSENFEDYLKSAMSYTNCDNLNDFTNNVNLIILSKNASSSFNK